MIIGRFCQPRPPVYSLPRLFFSTAYVNRWVFDEGNIKKITPYNEPDNTSGEFHFIKVVNYKNSRKSVILGNVYRSPSCKPDKLNAYFDTILQKLGSNRFSNKLINIADDFNQDIIINQDI